MFLIESMPQKYYYNKNIIHIPNLTTQSMRRKVSNAKQSKLWQNEHRVTDQRNTRTHKVAAKEHKVHILADKENIHPNVQRNESANDDFEKSKNEFFALKVQKQRKTN